MKLWIDAHPNSAIRRKYPTLAALKKSGFTIPRDRESVRVTFPVFGLGGVDRGALSNHSLGPMNHRYHTKMK